MSSACHLGSARKPNGSLVWCLLLSEAVAEVHRNSTLRSELIARREAKVSAIELEDPAGKFIDRDTVA